MRPHTTGCYVNGDPWKKHIAEGLNVNAHFKKNGYYTAAMGKTYHSSAGGLDNVYASEWDEYPPTNRENSAGRAPGAAGDPVVSRPEGAASRSRSGNAGR